MIILYVLFILILLLLFNVWKTTVYKYRELNKYPGPSMKEICTKMIGYKTPKETFDYIVSLNEDYGPVVKLWIKPLVPTLQVTSYSFVEEILLSKTHVVKTEMYDLLKSYIGRGIGIVQSPTLWKKSRSVLNPSMKIKCVESFAEHVFERHIDVMLEILKTKHLNQKVDMEPIAHLFALDVVFETVLGHQTNFQLNQNNLNLKTRMQYMEILGKRIYSLYLKPDFIFSLTKYYKMFTSAAKTIKQFEEEIVKKNLNQMLNYETVLKYLSQSELNFEEISDNVHSMIFGGHDTIGEALSICLYDIANCPQFQNQLYEELVETTNGKKIVKEDIFKLKKIESVIKESLRYHNVVPFIERRLKQDVSIDGVHIPDGTIIRFNLSGIHHSEEYFENPNNYIPERFLAENEYKMKKNSFVVFSLGPRGCIGKYYAMTILKYAIAKILEKFVLEPVEPKHNLTFVGELVAKSINGIPIVVKERNRKLD